MRFFAEETPELRRAYVKLPWPQLYEYPVSVASIAHEREYDGERAVLLSRIKGPEHCSIAELEASIQAARSRPVLEVKEFRRALKIARAPAPFRWLLMWLGLNIGRQRANYFGTFQLSVYSGLGAESLNPLTPLTTLLNYGPIGEDGSVNVRIHYDHRVMDGANVARALGAFREDPERRLSPTKLKLLGQELDAVPARAGGAPTMTIRRVDEFRPAVVVIGASGGIGTGNRQSRCPRARLRSCSSRARPRVWPLRRPRCGRRVARLSRSSWISWQAMRPAHLEDFLTTHGLVCDVLVNSAGYGLRGAATALPVDDQLGIIDLNIRALTELTLHFLPGMVARGRGGVLNLSSVAGFMPGPYMALYYASKGFVRSLFGGAPSGTAPHWCDRHMRGAGTGVRRSFSKGPAPIRTALFNVLPKLDPEYVAERAWRGSNPVVAWSCRASRPSWRSLRRRSCRPQ